MEDISKRAKILLKEIIKFDADTSHFEKYFEESYDWSKSKYQSESILRSSFGELKEAGLINIQWADGIPWVLSITSKGSTHKEEIAKHKVILILKWVIGTLIAIAAIVVPIIINK